MKPAILSAIIGSAKYWKAPCPLWSLGDIPGNPPHVGYAPAGSTGRRNTRVTLTKRSPNRLQDSRLPAMPKLRFLGRS
jgi:hypothetical protein